jgi:hypothetical protein
VLQFLVAATVVPSSPILVTLMIVAIRSSKTSVLTRVTRPNILEDGILQSYCCENFKSYVASTGWSLWLRLNVSPVRYEQGFYIPEDGILQCLLRESLKSNI